MQESDDTLSLDEAPRKTRNQRNQWIIYACLAGVLAVMFLLGSFYNVNQQQSLNRNVVTDIHQELLESQLLKQELGAYYQGLEAATVFDPTYKKGSELADVLVSMEYEGKMLAIQCIYNVEHGKIEQVTLNSDDEASLEGKVIVFENDKPIVTDEEKNKR